jgi:hypothetical protein
MENRRTNRRRYFLLIVVSFSSAVVISYLVIKLWSHSQREWTVSKLEELIKLEVPGNCDRRDIEVWFDRHNIEHQYIADTGADTESGKTMPDLAGLERKRLTGMVRGIIQGNRANVSFLFDGEIKVYFFLDIGGRQAGHYIHSFAYMP